MEPGLAPWACSLQKGLDAGDKVGDIIHDLGPDLRVETISRPSSQDLEKIKSREMR